MWLLLRDQHYSLAALGLVGRPVWVLREAAALGRASGDLEPQVFLLLLQKALLIIPVGKEHGIASAVRGPLHSQEPP